MEKISRLAIIIPIVCAALAVAGFGYIPHVVTPLACMIIILSLSRREVSSTSWLLVAALAFSIAGDWILKHRAGETMRFVYGIALFFIAHVGFLVFCLRNGRIRKKWLLALIVGYGLFFVFGLVPAIAEPSLLVAVLLYMFISCFSLAAAAGLRFETVPRCLFVAGIGCLVFSDTLIALYEFMQMAGWMYKTLMMPAYYAAHIFVTAAVIIPQKNHDF